MFPAVVAAEDIECLSSTLRRRGGVLLACSLLQPTARLCLGSNGELPARAVDGGIQAWGPTTNNRNGRRARQLHAVVRGWTAVYTDFVSSGPVL
jgi:hypothetical protein